MTGLTSAVTDVLTSATTLLSNLFTTTGETASVLNVVAALPIVSGIIGVVVMATRKGKG